MTLEQQRAIAIATAKVRLSQSAPVTEEVTEEQVNIETEENA